jgi:hypothetical protein
VKDEAAAQAEPKKKHFERKPLYDTT